MPSRDFATSAVTAARPPRSLAEDLAGRDDATLAAMLRVRPDLMHPTPVSFNDLAARASSRFSVGLALDPLDVATLTVAAACASLDAAGEGFEASEVRRILLEDSSAPSSVQGPAAPDVVDAALTTLVERGLVWGTSGSASPTAATLHAVGSLAEALGTAWLDSALAAPDLSIDQPQITARHDPAEIDALAGQHVLDVVRRVEELLTVLGRRPAAIVRGGGVAVREVAALQRLVDPAHAVFLLELAATCGLLAVDEVAGRDVVAPTEASEPWREADPGDQWTALALGWLSSRRVAALVPDAARPLSSEAVRPSAPLLRREVLGVLAEVPPGGALSADEVGRVLSRTAPRRGSALREAMIASTLAEAELLGIVARGALTDLGRALLEAADDQHRLGPSHLQASVQAAIPRFVEEIVVQGDHTIVAPGPLEPGLARQIQAVTEVESTGPATVYRLTESSVAKAMDAGWDGDAIVELLAGVSLTPIPQSVTYLIADVQRRHGQVRVGAATAYLRSADPAVATALLNAPQAGALGVRELVPGVLVATCDPRDLLDLARGAGVTVVAEAADGAVLEIGPGDEPLLIRTTGPGAGRLVDAATPASWTRTSRHAGAVVGADGRGRSAAPEAAVRALRLAAQSEEARNPTGEGQGQVPTFSPASVAEGPMHTAQVLRVLDRAMDAGEPVWLGYADNVGSTTHRVVDPLQVEAGLLHGFDHSSNEVRTFRITRITRVSPARGEHT